ncbi:hypothetical protein CSU32_24725 [Salmonella enterica subsp. diarizonae]|nr:hypothetical protein [Salmonella enterica subsp. diarizonae]ECI3360045.1 hypothetical protein [Salmonella enterica subsp. diarizonae]
MKNDLIKDTLRFLIEDTLHYKDFLEVRCENLKSLLSYYESERNDTESDSIVNNAREIISNRKPDNSTKENVPVDVRPYLPRLKKIIAMIEGSEPYFGQDELLRLEMIRIHEELK